MKTEYGTSKPLDSVSRSNKNQNKKKEVKILWHFLEQQLQD